jgi:hypothetical protein
LVAKIYLIVEVMKEEGVKMKVKTCFKKMCEYREYIRQLKEIKDYLLGFKLKNNRMTKSILEEIENRIDMWEIEFKALAEMDVIPHEKGTIIELEEGEKRCQE